MKVYYDARILNKKGNVVRRKKFRRKWRALKWVGKRLDNRRAAKIVKKVQRDTFSIESAADWGRSNHAPYQYGPRPVGTVFLHTSVTEQLGATTTRAKEREQMRKLDAIAKGRGFNGISYSIGIFPSGRCYEGRGWGVVEAATEGHNTTSDSVCFVGNTDAFEPTKAQLTAAKAVINKDGQPRGFLAKRGLAIRGHREVAAKACPGKFVTTAHLSEIERAVNG